MVIAVSALPGLAAIAALGISYVSVQATREQIQIAAAQEATDRYNAAITDLGQASLEIRLSGIYELQRVMQDSPRDQPIVIALLCAYIRVHSGLGARPQASSPRYLATDVQDALTIVGTRNSTTYGVTTVIDLAHAQLANAEFAGGNFTRAYLTGADLSHADLSHANLTGANLSHANLSSADLTGANLAGAIVTGTRGLPVSHRPP